MPQYQQRTMPSPETMCITERPQGARLGEGSVPLDARSADAQRRIDQARAMLVACEICPRMCGVARLAGETGVCRAGPDLIVASWNPHFGEEPPISGFGGSGTIFLSGCSLRCIYCQNYPISQMGVGHPVTVVDLVRVMFDLADQGVHNINFVTPTHVTPALIEVIVRARREGLTLPIVWNTSGYERIETLRLLAGLVDIYLADMRYSDGRAARRYSHAADYPVVNRKAIREMHRQVGTLVLDERGIAVRGVLIRHLVLPGDSSGSRAIFDFLAREISPDTAVSVMSQYFPAYRAADDEQIGRRLTAAEYAAALAAFQESGLHDGYCQEL